MSEESHYVDNEKFLKAMTEWKKEVIEAENSGDEEPPIPDYVGECFLLIAERLSLRANFINYPYREEMIGDAIENCVQYASNFCPTKSSNPFSYFTQIIYYAFLRRIQKEKKQNYIKYRIIEAADNMGDIANILDPEKSSKNPYADYFNLTETDIENFTPKKKSKKKTKKKKDDGEDSCERLF